MFYLILISNLVFSFGVHSFYLPQNAFELSNSNSGIGNSENININFSSINNLNDFISFSKINWYQDVTGDNIEYKWRTKDSHHYISLFSLYANKIELRDILPSDNPEGLFNIQHISFSYGFGHKILNSINMGIQSNFNYNQLYIDESIGFNFDIGLSYQVNNKMYFGLSIQKLGREKFNNEFLNNPILLGIGSTYKLIDYKTDVNIDLIYDEHLINHQVFKISSISKIRALSLITGYYFNENKKEFSCGFSFNYRKITFEYGTSFHKTLGNPKILTFKYNL